MLERVWRKGNPLTLLVGMLTSTATMDETSAAGVVLVGGGLFAPPALASDYLLITLSEGMDVSFLGIIRRLQSPIYRCE